MARRKRRRRKLVNLRIDEVSLVDLPANELAFSFIKCDDVEQEVDPTELGRMAGEVIVAALNADPDDEEVEISAAEFGRTVGEEILEGLVELEAERRRGEQ